MAALVAIGGTYSKYCRGGGVDCEARAEQLLSWIELTALICFAGVLLGILVYRRVRKTRPNDRSFKTRPDLFDGKFIELEVKVIKVIGDSYRERIRRATQAFLRKLLADRDDSYCHIHQRFLVTSCDLRFGGRLMVHHNTKYGSLNLKKGSRLRLKGEYIHRRRYIRTRWGGRRSYYGLLHKTHKPKGFVKVVGIS